MSADPLDPAVARPNGIGWAVVRERADGAWTAVLRTGLTEDGANAIAAAVNAVDDHFPPEPSTGVCRAPQRDVPFPSPTR